jgi:hypothetical protein
MTTNLNCRTRKSWQSREKRRPEASAQSRVFIYQFRLCPLFPLIPITTSHIDLIDTVSSSTHYITFRIYHYTQLLETQHVWFRFTCRRQRWRCHQEGRRLVPCTFPHSFRW